MTYSHPHPTADFFDGAVGFYPDGSRVELALATRIEVSAGPGGAAITLTRFFRSLESQRIRATLTLLSPLGGVLRGLTARVGPRSFVPPPGNHEQQADDDRNTPACFTEPHRGVHVVTVHSLRPGEEVMVSGRILAPLSFNGVWPRLTIPMRIADLTRQPLRAPGSTMISGRTAVLDVTPASGLALLDGRPLGDGPAIVGADGALELFFPGAIQTF